MSIGTPTTRDTEMMEKTLTRARHALAQGSVGIAALLLWDTQILALAHNAYNETGDLTAHAEMMAFRQAASQLNAMGQEQRGQVVLYCSLEPCLLCFAAAAYVGLRRIVYSALYEDGQEDLQVARHLPLQRLNPLLIRGPIELVPGVKREEGRALLALMGKTSAENYGTPLP